MPDITMCLNKDCPRSQDCYRFTVTPSRLQSYAMFKGGEECKYYLSGYNRRTHAPMGVNDD